jgi:hypothetical protein
MATAKQIAWRKKFAAMAKAGTLTKKRKAKTNPAAKKRAAPKTKAVSRPSQATGAAPSKRLKSRRKANTVPGMFPNPKARKYAHVRRSQTKADYRYTIQTQAPAGNWVDSLSANDLASVKAFAQYEADKHGKTVRIVDNKK